MSWLERLFGGGSKQVERQTPAPAATRSEASAQFAIIDVETTGLSPRLDRVIEMAVVRIDHRGQLVDEWATRFNPEGPVGATHIHGITDADVAHAPRFRDIAGQIVPHIAGLPIAAHNARFDLAFLRAEFRRAGWDVPWLPAFCTLDGSHHYMPHLDRRRLIDCCWHAGIRLDDAHSALGDARATAALLRHYLQHPAGPHPELETVRQRARSVTWPAAPSAMSLDLGDSSSTQRRSRPQRFTTQAGQPALITQLTKLSLLEIVDEGAPVGALTYLETLLDALEDGIITTEESASLHDLVGVYELDRGTLDRAHNAFLLALAHKALDDGHVSRDERGQLEAIARALNLPDTLVPALVAEADQARAARLSAHLKALPDVWTLGEPLRVGDKVAFTGCDDEEREELERRAQQLGVRVMNNVSRFTAMLITDGSFAGTKLAKAQELGTRIVTPGDFRVLLEHLQPAAVQAVKPARITATSTHRPVTATVKPLPAGSAAPSEIRAWAAANGYAVGVRGRLPSDVVQAYEHALGR